MCPSPSAHSRLSQEVSVSPGTAGPSEGEKVRRQSQKQPTYLAQNFNSFNSLNIYFIEPLLCAALFPDTITHPH